MNFYVPQVTGSVLILGPWYTNVISTDTKSVEYVRFVPETVFQSESISVISVVKSIYFVQFAVIVFKSCLHSIGLRITAFGMRIDC